MSGVRLVVGLGNPGSEYAGTRHNAGFALVEALADRWSGRWSLDRKFFAKTSGVSIGATRVVLVEPQTYMNESGRSVAPLARWHRVEPGHVLVVSDDADLPLGSIRMRPGGGAGGHRGLASIEQHLGTSAYPRLRLGIARPEQPERDIAGYVLGRFSSAEEEVFATGLLRACDQVECWLQEGVQVAMNRFNGSASGPAPKKGNQ